MKCACEKCPRKGQPECDKERLKFDVGYFRELLRKAEDKNKEVKKC